MYVSTNIFITKGNYVGYMFRLSNSHIPYIYFIIYNSVNTT